MRFLSHSLIIIHLLGCAIVTRIAIKTIDKSSKKVFKNYKQ